MLPTNSPLEHLAAFAIAFAAGVLTTVGFGQYIEKLKKKGEVHATRSC